MTRITHSDQILMLLRTHLDKASKPGKSNVRKTSETAAARSTASPLQRASALLAEDGLSHDKLGEILIGGLLAEEFGAGFANDPKFNTLVQDVTETIRNMEGGPELFDAAIRQLSNAGKGGQD